MWSLRAAKAASCAAVVAATAALSSGCQLKGTAVNTSFITVDPSAFVLKSVQRYEDPNGAQNDSSIVVITATYTNHEANAETIAPEKFELLDPNLMTTYLGLAGGGVYIPSMPLTQLAPNKSADIQIGFRVPSAMSGARLVYHP